MFDISSLIKNDELDMALIEDICKTLYYTTGISTILLDSRHRWAAGFGPDAGIESVFDDIFDGYRSDFDALMGLETHNVYTYSTKYDLSFITAILAMDDVHYGTLFIGPVLLNETSEHLINEVLQHSRLSLKKRNMLKELYHRTPLVHTPRNHYIYKMAASLISSPNAAGLAPSDEVALHLEDFESMEIAADATTAQNDYSTEILFLTKVSSGDVDKVGSLFNEQIKTQYFTRLAPQQLRTARNNAIVFATLLSRAAINGGVESDKALTLADMYISRIETLSGISELVKLVEHMAERFTTDVLHLSTVNHVNVIKNASKYVHMHLSEPIRLNDVAESVNLSPNYFSSLFKREMNISFADYVNQTRIKESQFLLDTTDYSILDIATSVGYNNQNYFTTIFRKFTGITPKQYRMRSSK